MSMGLPTRPRWATPPMSRALREAVSAALSYGSAESTLDVRPPVPPQLLLQARHAARNGVPLDTVLRRYFAGHALVSDFLVQEAERGDSVSRRP